MVTPKPPTGSYSASLRARRQARATVRREAPRIDALRIGNWILTDEDGALVIINQLTEARTILAEGGEDHGSM